MRRGLLVGLAPLWGAACNSSVQPKLAPCTAASAGQVSLAVAADTAIDPTQSAGCTVFGPNASASAYEYLLVPQAASGAPDDSSGFLLRGATVPAAAPRFAAPLRSSAAIPAQQQFELTLRRAGGGPGGRGGAPRPPPAPAPPFCGPPPPPRKRGVEGCGHAHSPTHPPGLAVARTGGTP